MTLRSLFSFFNGHRGRRTLGVSRNNQDANRPRVMVRIQVGGQELTR